MGWLGRNKPLNEKWNTNQINEIIRERREGWLARGNIHAITGLNYIIIIFKLLTTKAEIIVHAQYLAFINWGLKANSKSIKAMQIKEIVLEFSLSLSLSAPPDSVSELGAHCFPLRTNHRQCGNYLNVSFIKCLAWCYQLRDISSCVLELTWLIWLTMHPQFVDREYLSFRRNGKYIFCIQIIWPKYFASRGHL